MNKSVNKKSSKEINKEIITVINTEADKKITLKEPKAPWRKNLGGVAAHLEYRDGSMFEAVADIASGYPNYIAYDFMGGKTTYRTFIREIEDCARALKSIGVKVGEAVTICMPNAPQTMIMFYAVNLVGGIANMVHPLSSEKEIEFCIRESGSAVCLTLDQMYGKFENIRSQVPLRTLILTSVKDVLSPIKKKGYYLLEGRKIKKVPKDAVIVWWNSFILQGKRYKAEFRVKREAEDPAAILYSGGTTGKTKGILLSNRNFNALAAQIIATNKMFKPGDKMLAIMPMFHGFGLGVSIHSMVASGGRCILIPRFNAESYAKLLKKHQPNFIAGVPTLYEALLRLTSLDKVDLSCLKGVFSGGDSLSVELKKRFDYFLKSHGAHCIVREGYGTTECVTASCLTPVHMYREGSIGLPFPDTYYKIVKVGTTEEVPYGEEGEICLTGPTLMMKYINNPEETANTLKVHEADGHTWLHTGDLGMMDEDGFIYFRQRIKRMIVTSGYNVYPSQIENVLDAHEKVHMSCVIGVPDSLKMQKVIAFIVLKPGFTPSEEIKDELLAYCSKYVAKYAMPKSIEFRKMLPTTLVGKVAYRELEQEMAERAK